jgi:hypothetical protein
MTIVHRGMGAAVREALRQHQVEELATARRCPDCGRPVREDVRTRLTLVAQGRIQDERDLDLCRCGLESVPTAGNAAMPSAPPRSLPQAGEGDGLRPAARDRCAHQQAVPQGLAVAMDSAPQESTARPGVRRRRLAGASRPPVRFTLRSRPHHRTDAESLAVIYRVKALLQMQDTLHDVAERVEFHSCRMEGGEWLQHVELAGRCDPAGWPVLGRIIERHPGWVLSWE